MRDQRRFYKGSGGFHKGSVADLQAYDGSFIFAHASCYLLCTTDMQMKLGGMQQHVVLAMMTFGAKAQRRECLGSSKFFGNVRRFRLYLGPE